jgi:hypothetical protein
MILPTKHIKLSNSLLGLSAELLKYLNGGQTVTSLWGNVRHLPEVKTFERFTLGLDFLYSLGVIEFEDGLLRRNPK